MRHLSRFVFFCILAAVPDLCFGLDGAWQLHNQFEIGIVDGQASGLKVADGDPLNLFMFDPTHSKQDVPVPMKISMTDLRSNQVVAYDAKGIDSSDTGMIMIGVPKLNDLYLVLYLIKIDDSDYMYSYSLAFNLQKGTYVSAKDSKDYIIFIGTMKRITK